MDSVYDFKTELDMKVLVHFEYPVKLHGKFFIT